MATRFHVYAPTIADAGTDENTEGLDLTQFPLLTIQAVWTGLDALDATLQPEVSNNGVHWLPPSGGEGPITLSASADTDGWEWQKMGWRYVRVKYVANSVTEGLISLYFFAKRSD